MLKKSFILLLLLIGSLLVKAQNCPDYVVELTSQSAIDNFIELYPNCSMVNRLNIIGEDITNLKGLRNLDLEDISCFNNLKSIAEITIRYNQQLKNIRKINKDFSSTGYYKVSGNKFNKE